MCSAEELTTLLDVIHNSIFLKPCTRAASDRLSGESAVEDEELARLRQSLQHAYEERQPFTTLRRHRLRRL